LRVWDVETAKQIRTFSGHTQSTLAVDYDNTGKLLASGYVLFLVPFRVENEYL
jgi:COMPASS component SWD3